MEKRKAQMHVEERDRRAEELKNQMINVIPEVEETPSDDDLPFEIPGVETTEEVIEEEPLDEEPVEEEIKEEEKVEKKDNTKQSTLFNF